MWPNWSMTNLRTRGFHLISPIVFPVSAIKAQRQYVREIFYMGLMPGEMTRSGGRKHVNLSPFLPHDPRNTAVGRQHDSYDTIIIFKKDRVLSEHEMLMSANGIVATTEVLRPDLIQLLLDNIISDGSRMILTFVTLSHVGTPLRICHDHIIRTRCGSTSVELQMTVMLVPILTVVFSTLRALRPVPLVDVSSRSRPSLALAR